MDYLHNKNLADNDGSTPCHIAASEGNLELCRIIINNVNDKNPADNEGHKSLHQAVYNTSQLQICQLIIKNISDKNPANEDGVTPLHFAALYGLFETCKLIANNIVNKC